MAQEQAEATIKQIQTNFKTYDDYFEFPACPAVDESIKRNLPDYPNHQEAVTRDKGMLSTSTQFKLLDLVKPLIVQYYSLTEGGMDAEAEYTYEAIQLWAKAFHSITKVRRRNMLRVSHPKYLSFLKNGGKFAPEESGALFGASFIEYLRKEMDEPKESERGVSKRPHQTVFVFSTGSPSKEAPFAR